MTTFQLARSINPDYIPIHYRILAIGLRERWVCTAFDLIGACWIAQEVMGRGFTVIVVEGPDGYRLSMAEWQEINQQ